MWFILELVISAPVGLVFETHQFGVTQEAQQQHAVMRSIIPTLTNREDIVDLSGSGVADTF